MQLDRCIEFIRQRPDYPARVVVGSRWGYTLSIKAVKYWNAEAGILLVDWSKMYEQYFAVAAKRRNKMRVKRTVNCNRDLEKKTLRIEPGERSASYGESDILPATAAEVVLTCRHEGQGSEDSLERSKQKLSVRKVKARVKRLAKGMADMFTRRDGEKG